MGTKTISIMDDVYVRLKTLKSPEESFSDQIRRLTEEKGNLLQFAGLWKNIPEKEIKEIKKTLEKMRGGERRRELREKMS